MISDFTGYTHSSNTNSPPVIKGRILHLQKQIKGQLLPPKDTEQTSHSVCGLLGFNTAVKMGMMTVATAARFLKLISHEKNHS